MTERPERHPLLSMRGIHKSFGATAALVDVDLDLDAGEIRGIVGANGAGKSTLMKILQGVHTQDGGTITITGETHRFTSPNQARAAGIGMVFQEFSLIPQLSTAANIHLSNPIRGPFGLTRPDRESTVSFEILVRLGVQLDVERRVEELDVAQQQLAEIAKALSSERRMLILDEPTASLGKQDASHLIAVLRRLARQGVGILFISHHLHEVMDLCDSLTILRDGRVVHEGPVEQVSLEEVVRTMTGGSEVGKIRPGGSDMKTAPTILRARAISSGPRVVSIDFELRAGEVVGVAGLLGSGRSEFLLGLYGGLPLDSGTVTAGNGEPIESVRDAIRLGVALVPEDRRAQGLVLEYGMRDNIALPILDRLSVGPVYRPEMASRASSELAERLSVKLESHDQPMTDLSGGNQQKVVVAKALASRPKVLLLDDPTFGIDIRTSAQIMYIVGEFARSGGAAVWVSSDFEELVQVANRIVVLRDGHLVREMDNSSLSPVTEEDLLVAVQ